LTWPEQAFENVNVCSAAASPRSADLPDDRSTAARIRDAALACFAGAGVRATTVRQVAARAGVAPGTVIHHFGSKDGLRTACDAFVAAHVRDRKRAALRQGPNVDPLSLLRSGPGEPPILAYLARTLGDGSEHVAALVDELVDDAEALMAEGVASGAVRASDQPRGVAAVLVLWSLGALVLHEHVERVLGVDLTTAGSGLEATAGYSLPALEILGRGLIDAAWYERLSESVNVPPDGGDS
jgi:AcrR family transcriptional regulator